MPTYEYQCQACEYNFEEFQSITAKPLKKCPQCRKPKLRRLLGTGAAILFKGSGFYQTDYRSESYKAAAKADEEKGKPATADKVSANGRAEPGGVEAAEKGKKSKAKTAKSESRVSDD